MGFSIRYQAVRKIPLNFFFRNYRHLIIIIIHQKLIILTISYVSIYLCFAAASWHQLVQLDLVQFDKECINWFLKQAWQGETMQRPQSPQMNLIYNIFEDHMICHICFIFKSMPFLWSNMKSLIHISFISFMYVYLHIFHVWQNSPCSLSDQCCIREKQVKVIQMTNFCKGYVND